LKVGVELDVKVDVVVDNVFAEEAEESAGAVNAAELGAVEIEHALCREALAIGSGDEDGELDLASDAAQGELTALEVIGVPSVQVASGVMLSATNSATG
jgi:hypothetical protein